jgi:hypothetical protein
VIHAGRKISERNEREKDGEMRKNGVERNKRSGGGGGNDGGNDGTAVTTFLRLH